jgi:hypothetical protein
MTDDKAYREAKKRVKAKIGFCFHLATYIFVNLMLIFIWYFATGGGYKWFLWPLMGWGIGVFFHGLGVFVASGSLMERMIQKELERDRE